jgi:hypothetical protein
MQRENVEPHKLEEIIKSSVSELREIETQIDAKGKSFEDTKLKVDEEMKRLKIKEKELDVFRQIMLMLEMYDYYEISRELTLMLVERYILEVESLYLHRYSNFTGS